MGLFDFLFGTTTKSSSTSSASGTSSQQQSNTGTQQSQQSQTSSNTGSTATTNQSATQQQQQGTTQQVGSTLDAGTIAALQGLVNPTAANAGAAIASGATTANSDALKQIAGVAANNGTGGNDATVNAAIAADQAKAKLDFQTGEGQQIKQTQQQIGSTGNTYSQLIENKGQSDLATQLNQITANAKLNELGLNNQSLQTAISALTQASATGATDATAALNPLLAIAAALKGATTTQTGVTSQTGSTTGETSQTTIQDLINQITGQTNTTATGTATANTETQSTQNQSGKSTTTQGLLPSIVNLF